MTYRLELASAAARYFKKLKEQRLKSAYREALENIAANPYVGQAKRGDLAGVYGYDVRLDGVSYEVAYRIYDENELVVVVLAGTRENFYQELKRHLK